MSDIRKIQTGNTQYTLHARVTDKIANSAGSPTRPVYVDANGDVQACSREIPAVDTALSSTSTNPVQNKAINAALGNKADKAQLSSYLTTTAANDTYAKKTDISTVYRYKGTKATYAELPTSNTTGDVWNITAADAAHGIKAGDNVVWDGNAWDNLSGVVDIEYPYTVIFPEKRADTDVANGYACDRNPFELKEGDIVRAVNLTRTESPIYNLFIEYIDDSTFDPIWLNDDKPKTISKTGLYQAGAQLNTELGGNAIIVYRKGSTLEELIANMQMNSAILANPEYIRMFLVGEGVDETGEWAVTSKTVYKALQDKADKSALSNYLQKGGSQTTTSTADGGSNVYTFKDGSKITVKNGSKGSTGPQGTKGADGTSCTHSWNGTKLTVTSASGTSSADLKGPQGIQGPTGPQGAAGTSAVWFSGTVVTGTSTTAAPFTVPGSKAGDMYLNTGTSNVYKATAANKWVYVCNIKGAHGANGTNGTTPTIKAANGSDINTVGTPSVTASTTGTTTTFTFHQLKGQKGDAADIPKLAKGVAGIVPGTINDSLSASRWLNGGGDGTGAWRALPTAAGGTSGMVLTCKDYTGTIARENIPGYAHGTTPPTLQPITTGANDYRGVESDGSGRLFVNVPAYEKNISREASTVLAAPTGAAGTATFRKLKSADIPWSEKLKVVTEAQFSSTNPIAGVFYFILEE